VKRLLFLSGWYPYPSDNGSKIRIFNLIRRLAGQYEIHLLSFADGPVSPERLERMKEYCVSVNTAPWVEFQPGRLRAILGFLSSRPRAVVDTYSLAMQGLVKRMAESQAFDLVVASEWRTAAYAALVSCSQVFEDLELTVFHEQLSGTRDPLRRARHRLTWWKMTHYLSRLLPQFDACTVVSEPERAILAGIAPDYDRVAVVPNGVDLNYYAGDHGKLSPASMIYTGALSYHANFDAVEYFLQDVYSLIVRDNQEASLSITGKAEPALIDRLPKRAGVTFTGYLPDVRPAVARSWVSVVPLRIGGGTRLKIIEAMALGTPVVSTSKGAEGLDVTHGRDILIADEPKAFAGAILKLFADADLRAELAVNGRRLVEERYSWDTCAERLIGTLQAVAGG